MSLTLGTFCSGIGSPELAATRLGWKCKWSSEIEPFPSAVLAHHFPHTPNLGDMTKLHGGDLEPVDVVFAGTPCQDFSIIGRRAGLAGARGNLTLGLLRIVDALRPRWLDLENVAGILSSNGGRDFGAFLGALAKLGYGWAYRVLDAQFVRTDGFERAVPQSRRRVFVVAHSGGNWQRAAAVLFERQSMSGDSSTRGEARQGTQRVFPCVTRDGPGCLREEESYAVEPGGRIRRLMPVEYERLQGFPDDYTNIIYRGKPAADAPRYRAIGNSIAVNCSRWILERIQMVESINQMSAPSPPESAERGKL